MRSLRWDSTDPDTGQPYKWGNPNLRWGSPSVVLEPGDSGYVPPPSSPTTTTKPKTKAMTRQRYYPARTAEQIIWLKNFADKLPKYATALSLTDDERDAVVVDCRWLDHILSSYLPATRAWAQACTAAAIQAQTGTGGTLVLPVFTPPPLPAGVTPQKEGGLNRIFDFVGELKQNDLCTPAMCADLSIIGPEDTPPDYLTLRPSFTVQVTPAGVQIPWTFGGNSKFLDQLEIQVDRGTGWQILTFDTTPGYVDTHPQPTSLAQWKYRGIYRLGDTQVGLWSETMTVTVGA